MDLDPAGAAAGTLELRYTLLPNGVLQITSAHRYDSGLFRCIASNIANIRYSHEAQLSVTVAGSRTYKEPIILSGPQNLTINIHQTAILECIATGNPRPIVSWSRLDGRSIGVEGIQVLGTGNLMISDATLQHSGVYVCSANRPGSRSRRTAFGRLVVQAPPEFVQWPQSLSRPAGGSAVFSCMATGVPEPHLIWLKNGKLLTPSDNGKLTSGNMTLAITHITPEDEAIYQCIAENSAGTNQASARLTISQGPKLPEAPTGLRATTLSTSGLHLTWDQPDIHASQQIIGYVLHIRRLGEPDGAELQEAVDKTTFSHDFNNLESATTYSIYLKAYSAHGGSQQSNTITATTLGGVPSPPSFFTKVLNQTAMQVYWELPDKPGKVKGFRLEYREISNPDLHGQEIFPGHINTHTISHLELAAVYEIQLVAFNGNGNSTPTRHLVSLSEGRASTAAGQSCNCDQADGSMSTLLLGVHSSLACILCCLLLVLLGYRHSFFCRKKPSWETPPTLIGVRGPKGHTPESIELSQFPGLTSPLRTSVCLKTHQVIGHNKAQIKIKS
ncbi:immunoglobulin superfamily DCC subclass member 3-like [Nematolebias whitei]|uniref:immunoglobulin superfamily DCC subclass member 3-like n=1 Tax=Nematolebias whitei TaxID=451745 RepID=UPI0018980056|nr:immunoglobulin superfamily DCC subclass member 3-like [Nematolebias whitei]